MFSFFELLYQGILFSCPTCKVKEHDQGNNKESDNKYSDNIPSKNK